MDVCHPERKWMSCKEIFPIPTFRKHPQGDERLELTLLIVGVISKRFLTKLSISFPRSFLEFDGCGEKEEKQQHGINSNWKTNAIRTNIE